MEFLLRTADHLICGGEIENPGIRHSPLEALSLQQQTDTRL